MIMEDMEDNIVFVQLSSGQELIGYNINNNDKILTMTHVLGIIANGEVDETGTNKVMMYPISVATVGNIEAEVEIMYRNISFLIEEHHINEEVLQNYKNIIKQMTSKIITRGSTLICG